MTDRNRARFAVIAMVSVFGLSCGLTAPLIALELADAGFSATMVGANAAAYALGVLIVAPILPGLSFRFGLRGLARSALAGAGILFLLFPVAPALWLWFPLRAALGAMAESLFVLSENWLNQLVEDGGRARMMAVYVAAMSGGIALGPLILAWPGRSGPAAFLVGGGLALSAYRLLTISGAKAAPVERPPAGNPLRHLRYAWLPVAASALNAAIEVAGLNLLPLYAMHLGWSEQAGTLLLTILLPGAILLQLPIGWLADRMRRDRLVSVLATLATAGAMVWPMAMGYSWIAYPLLFFWGGAFAGIYTTMLAIVGERFKGSDPVGVYATLSAAWGIGALVGPLTAGFVMQLARHGLPVFAAAACGAFAFFSLLGRGSESEHLSVR